MNKSIIDINSLQPNKTKVLYKYLGKNRVGTVQSIMKNSTIPGETTYTLKIDNTPIGLESVTEVIKDELSSIKSSQWRLPTIEEFKNILYPNEDKIPNISSGKYDYYWSSSKHDTLVALAFDFSNGKYFYNGKDDTGYVRAVRDVSKNSTNSSNSTIIQSLEVWNNDLGKMTWDEAIEAVKKLNQKTDNKMAKGGGIEKGIDLFEDYDNIPNNVQSILDKYSSAFEDGEYKGLENALKELNKIGYTFDYDLEGQAYDLRKTSQKGKSSYAKGGGVGDTNWVVEFHSKKNNQTKVVRVNAKNNSNAIDKAFRKLSDMGENTDEYSVSYSHKSNYSNGGGVGKTFTYEVKQNKWTLFPNNRYYRRFFIPKSDSNSYREITEHGVTEEIVEQNDIYDITISVTKQGKEYFEKTYKGKYAKGGGVGSLKSYYNEFAKELSKLIGGEVELESVSNEKNSREIEFILPSGANLQLMQDWSNDGTPNKPVTEIHIYPDTYIKLGRFGISYNATEYANDIYEQIKDEEYAKGGGVGTKGKTNKEISDMYWQEAEDIDKEINSDRGGETSGPNWERIEKLEKERDRYRKLAIKYDSKMIKGGRVGKEYKYTIPIYDGQKHIGYVEANLKSEALRLKAKAERDIQKGLKPKLTYNVKKAKGGGVGVKKNELQKGYVALKSYWKVASKPSKLKEVPTTTINSIDRDAVINYLNSLEVISEYLEGNVPYTNPDVGYGPIEENYLLYDKEEGDIYFIDTQGYNYPRYITRLAGYKPKSSEEFKLGGGVGGNKKISEAIDDIVKYATLPPQIDYVKPYAFKSEKAYRYLESLPNGKKYIDRAHRKIDEYYESDAPHYDSLFKNGGGINSQFEYTIGGL